MEIMDNLISLDEELIKNKKAKCPRCKEGIIRPVLPHQTNPTYFACDKCDEKVIFDRNVVVE